MSVWEGVDTLRATVFVNQNWGSVLKSGMGEGAQLLNFFFITPFQ